MKESLHAIHRAIAHHEGRVHRGRDNLHDLNICVVMHGEPHDSAGPELTFFRVSWVCRRAKSDNRYAMCTMYVCNRHFVTFSAQASSFC